MPLISSHKHHASIPAGARAYAIGDIHGSIKPLIELMELIRADIGSNPGDTPRVIFLGDYIDRGMFSKQVIDYLINEIPASQGIFLRGNHEELALQFLNGDYSMAAAWLKYGGLATLMSYGVTDQKLLSSGDPKAICDEFRAKLPPSHLAFLNATKDIYFLGDYCFVHAGVKPGVDLQEQSRHDLLWIRREFLETTDLQEKMIVHGHNISMEPDIRPNRIGVDTGAYETGRLTSLVLQGNHYSFLHS